MADPVQAVATKSLDELLALANPQHQPPAAEPLATGTMLGGQQAHLDGQAAAKPHVVADLLPPPVAQPPKMPPVQQEAQGTMSAAALLAMQALLSPDAKAPSMLAQPPPARELPKMDQPPAVIQQPPALVQQPPARELPKMAQPPAVVIKEPEDVLEMDAQSVSKPPAHGPVAVADAKVFLDFLHAEAGDKGYANMEVYLAAALEAGLVKISLMPGVEVARVEIVEDVAPRDPLSAMGQTRGLTRTVSDAGMTQNVRSHLPLASPHSVSAPTYVDARLKAAPSDARVVGSERVAQGVDPRATEVAESRY